MRHLQHIDVSVKIVVEQTVVDVFYEIVLSLLVAVPGKQNSAAVELQKHHGRHVVFLLCRANGFVHFHRRIVKIKYVSRVLPAYRHAFEIVIDVFKRRLAVHGVHKVGVSLSGDGIHRIIHFLGILLQRVV